MENNIWKKHPQIIDMLNSHYNLELKASNLYFNMATVFKSLGYEQVCLFFVTLAKDKQKSHMARILDYFTNLDQQIYTTIDSIPEKIQSKNVVELINIALSMEIKIRENVKLICQECLKHSDFETFEFIQWFVKDAIKDLQDVDDIATYIKAPGASLLTIENAARRKNKSETNPLYE